jgi:hypothetical protein
VWLYTTQQRGWSLRPGASLLVDLLAVVLPEDRKAAVLWVFAGNHAVLGERALNNTIVQ